MWTATRRFKFRETRFGARYGISWETYRDTRTPGHMSKSVPSGVEYAKDSPAGADSLGDGFANSNGRERGGW
jgi:hypothetical protein